MKLKPGDKVKLRDLPSYKFNRGAAKPGMKGEIESVGENDTVWVNFGNFKWYGVEDEVELIYDHIGYEGWANEATFHAHMVLTTDSKMLDDFFGIDKGLMCKEKEWSFFGTRYRVSKWVTELRKHIPEHLTDQKIDIYRIAADILERSEDYGIWHKDRKLKMLKEKALDEFVVTMDEIAEKPKPGPEIYNLEVKAGDLVIFTKDWHGSGRSVDKGDAFRVMKYQAGPRYAESQSIEDCEKITLSYKGEDWEFYSPSLHVEPWIDHDTVCKTCGKRYSHHYKLHCEPCGENRSPDKIFIDSGVKMTAAEEEARKGIQEVAETAKKIQEEVSKIIKGAAMVTFPNKATELAYEYLDDHTHILEEFVGEDYEDYSVCDIRDGEFNASTMNIRYWRSRLGDQVGHGYGVVCIYTLMMALFEKRWDYMDRHGEADNLREKTIDCFDNDFIVGKGTPITTVCSTKTAAPTAGKVFTNMNEIKTINYVNGRDINEYSDAEVIQLIEDTEAEIVRLDKLGNDSKLVVKQREEREQFLKDVIKLADARVK